jgi:hypothetical protein
VPFSRASIEEREGHSLGRVDVKPDWRREIGLNPIVSPRSPAHSRSGVTIRARNGDMAATERERATAS